MTKKFCFSICDYFTILMTIFMKFEYIIFRYIERIANILYNHKYVHEIGFSLFKLGHVVLM